MALVSLRQLLDHAAENGYGLPELKYSSLKTQATPGAQGSTR